MVSVLSLKDIGRKRTSIYPLCRCYTLNILFLRPWFQVFISISFNTDYTLMTSSFLSLTQTVPRLLYVIPNSVFSLGCLTSISDFMSKIGFLSSPQLLFHFSHLCNWPFLASSSSGQKLGVIILSTPLPSTCSPSLGLGSPLFRVILKFTTFFFLQLLCHYISLSSPYFMQDKSC